MESGSESCDHLRYYRLITEDGDSRLAVETNEGFLSDITSVDYGVTELNDLALASALSGMTIDAVTNNLLSSGRATTHPLRQIVANSRDSDEFPWLDRPVDPPEVWAAGVTYKSSEMERRRESTTPDVYSRVYDAERPELFLKATPERCVGPFESVGIRSDSTWDVPEPELAFVLYRGQIIGYTVGNDMSSRSIEGDNPLYVPQAKLYARSCAIGPCIATTDTVHDPHDLQIRATIRREGQEVFSGQASSSQMARKCEDLADWLQRSNVVPDMTVVLTGTAIVPKPGFTLQEGDIVAIEIENIGRLENDVVVV